MNTHELAWAAGFFDGEGSTGVHGGAAHVAVIQNETHEVPGLPYVLERFRQAVGVGKIYGPYDYRCNARQTRRYDYRTASFEHAQAIIAMLWAWLSPIKRTQAARALKGDRTFTNAHGRRGSHPQLVCKNGHAMTPENIRFSAVPEGKRRRCLLCSRQYHKGFQREYRRRQLASALLEAV